MVNGTDSVFYNYLATRDFNGLDWGECSYKRYSWMGLPVIVKDNGWTYFVNSNQGTIKINQAASENESWPTLYVSSDSIIWATVTDISNLIILGLNDDVKTISFSMKDANNNTLQHHVNGTSIQIAETLGLIKSVDLFHFPDHIEEQFHDNISITGAEDLEVGLRRPTTELLFEPLASGDELAYRAITNNHASSFPNPAQESKYLIKILAVQLQLETMYQMVKHSSFRYWQGVNPFPNYQQITDYNSDTVWLSEAELWPFHSSQSGQAMPGEIFSLPNSTDGFNIDYQLTGDTIDFTHFSTAFGDLEANGCIDDMTFEYMPWNVQYKERLGAVHAETYNAYDDSQYWLTYLKRGSNVWGSPTTVSQVLDVDEFSEALSEIHPNPAQRGQSVHISIPINSKIRLFSIEGKEMVLDMKLGRIQTTALKSGVYLLRIETESGVSTQKLVITD